VLRALHRLGLRSAQLTAHNWVNHFADPCCAPPRWNGLTERGREVVREMNRLGIAIDVSHASDAAIEQALEISTAPLIATHGGLRSLNDIPRTMPDELLRKLARKGGVIGIHLGNEFHNPRLYELRKQRAGNRPFWDTSEVARRVAGLGIDAVDALVRGRDPDESGVVGAPAETLFSVDDWIAVVERAMAIAGEDHVALGSDLDGGPTLPRGMRDARDLPQLTEAMLRRGWPEARIRKFLGGNLLRVFRQIAGPRR
jgi:membrane dipeptidase